VKAASFPAIDDAPGAARATSGSIAEAAPGRLRIRALAVALMILFTGLAGRAVQLAVLGAPAPAKTQPAATAALVVRADLVDRNGVLLATTIPGFQLTAEPKKVWDPADVARRLGRVLPDLDVAEAERRLAQRDRAIVYLKRDLTPRQRDAIFDLGLPGVGFVDQARRVYPQGELAVHALGGINGQFAGAAGLELGLDDQIRRNGAAGEPLRLSIDVRIQHALEAELAAAIDKTQAQGGAGIVLDGRTGETLAIASAPGFDPNSPPTFADDRRINRAAGSVYEMGSTIKPFTIAMALDAGLTKVDERFNLSQPIEIEGYEIKDLEQLGAGVPLARALAESSNIMAAKLALRVGADRQRATLAKLGLFDRAAIELPESGKPIPPDRSGPLTTAVLGYGHGMAMSLAALAGAYTVFANDGARVAPTLLAHARGDEIRKTPVFSRETSRAVLAMMRGVVTSGTAQRAEIKGLDIAGKTGSAEKPHKGAYAPDLLLSSFAAIFPARDPHYVIVVALDEPHRVVANGNLATGGAVAAPVVGRVAARIAPLLGVTATENGGESP
jgi:cell division protein FtsI (penicillin-binding protein 3)